MGGEEGPTLSTGDGGGMEALDPRQGMGCSQLEQPWQLREAEEPDNLIIKSCPEHFPV